MGSHLQSYVSADPSVADFPRVENNQTIHTRALQPVRNSYLLDNFWNFDDYREDNNAPFLKNNEVGETPSNFTAQRGKSRMVGVFLIKSDVCMLSGLYHCPL